MMLLVKWTLFYTIQFALDPTYVEFGYNEHPSTTSRFLYIKIIDYNVERFGYNEHPLITSSFFCIFTGRNEVLAKVIFSQACVILFTGGSGPGGVPPNFGGVLQIFGGFPPNFFWGGSSKFSGGSPPEYGQHSAGTHPTGMHSCFTRCKWDPVFVQ